ncbi:pilus assembly protein PilP [Sulfurifustis variabilis]|uniref:Pilus assembly protein PilP n=1 Tax=Sulfurifustis variabilis TaxID=1675686 RepID=A0A1B4V5W7_9GAMM|nr:pilus assembly protein PilP [Sulfurifustis variabilis]BAU46634.1 pilus assembly protein PilP [Sulfurifustis variabilis]
MRFVDPRFLAASLILLLLSACADDGMDDLRHFVETAHQGKQPRIEPLPEIKTQEQFSYGAVNLRDPFTPRNLKAQAGQSGGGPRPDMNRRREALEEFPLDALKMVGTLQQGKQAWVVIQAPDGSVHRATVGNHLGQNFGAITRITEDKINLIELVQGPLGDWIERESSLALAE